MPDWWEFTRRVVNTAFRRGYSADEFAKAVVASGWRLESWIQAAANEFTRHGNTRQNFNVVLQQELYGDLLARARTDGVERQVLHALQMPSWYATTEAAKVCDFFERHYGDTSLMRLVKWLLAAEQAGRMPFAVVSFNVEPLFHTVFNCFHQRAYAQKYESPRFRLERVTTPNYVRTDPPERLGNSTTVLVYHCHGALIPRVPHNTVLLSGAGDPILSEEDYNDVSGRAATWPETVFMYHANFSRMVFVGISTTDPNIRRWLCLSQEQTNAGKVLRGGRNHPPHLWIHKPTEENRSVLESGLSHLGVMPAWTQNWDELGNALANLTGTSSG
ncbi:MAG: SIR2 family protein [Verrucomicrobiota bacterium]